MKHRSGFSFPEVLFAVMILGIGFIMVAAIFPAALSQTKLTMEETSAASTARGGVGFLETTIPSNLLPATGTAASPRGIVVAPGMFPVPAVLPAWYPAFTVPQRNDVQGAWNAIKRNLMVPSNNRYGAVVMYRRDGEPADPATWSPYAHVIVIPTAIRNQGSYEKYDPDTTMLPRAVTFDMNATQVTFTGGASAAAAEGAYLVVANDQLANLPDPPPPVKPPPPRAGWMNGRIFRIGANVAGDTWELAPGAELGADGGPDGIAGAGPWGPYGTAADDIVALDDANGFIVGRGMEDPADPATALEGPAQDIAAYTTFIVVR